MHRASHPRGPADLRGAGGHATGRGEALETTAVSRSSTSTSTTGAFSCPRLGEAPPQPVPDLIRARGFNRRSAMERIAARLSLTTCRTSWLFLLIKELLLTKHGDVENRRNGHAICRAVKIVNRPSRAKRHAYRSNEQVCGSRHDLAGSKG